MRTRPVSRIGSAVPRPSRGQATASACATVMMARHAHRARERLRRRARGCSLLSRALCAPACPCACCQHAAACRSRGLRLREHCASAAGSLSARLAAHDHPFLMTDSSARSSPFVGLSVVLSQGIVLLAVFRQSIVLLAGFRQGIVLLAVFRQTFLFQAAFLRFCFVGIALVVSWKTNDGG